MDDLTARVRDKIEAFAAALRDVCSEHGRAADSVELCAVSKYATTTETRAMARALDDLDLPILLGESRVQDLLPKAAELASESFAVRWHLIGTLQRNKARAVLGTIECIHSLDRPAILERVSALGVEQGRVLEGFLQVKTSGEDEKSGFEEHEVEAVLAHCAELGGLRVVGLMTMAPRGSDHESARPYFARLRSLRDRVAPELAQLSMGMSGDWRGAVAEGATILRIGSALHA